jgi:peptidoglycan hydrolase-like protein with peptidoglycan-binding domain
VFTGAFAIQASAAAPVAQAAKKPKKSKRVAAVQRKLGVHADGILGPRTKRALKRWQKAHGLTADGVIGPQTLGALGLDGRAQSASSGGTTAATRPVAATGDPATVLAALAACESGGDPTAVSPDGRFRGKYQFSRGTWRDLGGSGDPADAPEADQDRLAAALYAQKGLAPWPACGGRIAEES